MLAKGIFGEIYFIIETSLYVCYIMFMNTILTRLLQIVLAAAFGTYEHIVSIPSRR